MFYNWLGVFDKVKFEYWVYVFLLNVWIDGVGIEVMYFDCILIVFGVIIFIFGFDIWYYFNIECVEFYLD